MEGQEQTSGMLTGLTNPEQLSPQEKQEIDSYTT